MAGGITELVVFGVICSILFVAFMVYKSFFVKGKGNPNWMPGQHYEVRPPDPEMIGIRRREKYVDPLAKLNPIYIGTAILVSVALVFFYYFMIKGGLVMGN